MADPNSKREMEADITAALAKMGVGGKVIIRDGAAELHGHGNEVIAIDLAEWLEQWALLPADMRARRAGEAAQRLRAAAAGHHSETPRRPFPLAAVGGGALALVLLAVVVGWLRIQGFFGSDATSLLPSGSTTPSASAAPIDPAVRQARTCGAARSRLQAGAGLGLDTAGWVVELWLADVNTDHPLRNNERVLKAVRGQSAKAIAPPPPYRVQLVDPPRGDIGAEQAVIQFREGFVTRFFTVQGRQAMVEHAADVAAGSGAQYAALYARCMHLPYHDVGVWYAGRSDKAAVVSLLYAAGTFSEPPAVAYNQLNERGDALDVLEHALILADRAAGGVDAFAEVTRVGGRVASDKRSLSFGLAGPTLANKASRNIAAALPL